MLIREINDLNLLLVRNLHRIRNLGFDVIVHLPRSGTIPASLLATYLRAPFASVDEFCAGMVNTRKSEYSGLNRILLVDDSIRTGQQMKAAVERIRAARPGTEIRCLSVYGTVFPERVHNADLILSEHEDVEYVYPWFLWKTKRIRQCAVDMDGVLCRDCTREEDDDGPAYAKFLRNADLKFRPEFPIGAIVTGRLEKYRCQTEDWLRRNNVLYKKLVMGPWPCNVQRRVEGAASWKAKVYRTSNYLLFVESSAKEAEIIARLSGRKVWCIDDQREYGA